MVRRIGGCSSAVRDWAWPSAQGLVPGVRAVTVNDACQVEGSVLLNNAQVITMGQMFMSLHQAHALVDRWLDLRYGPASEWAPLMDAMVDHETEYARKGHPADPSRAVAPPECGVPG
ncbi:RpiB/LacA/LacB family sugar-phosphate isomerase [Streptomyces sp. NPDC001404]|uniref:RpiB/LacA/LacB family sugar-phosphate isomerase n=1 Tax=Streptomyces sp. NPDC001404 TaxID=3364571 RepID=UPI00368EEB4E